MKIDLQSLGLKPKPRSGIANDAAPVAQAPAKAAVIAAAADPDAVLAADIASAIARWEAAKGKGKGNSAAPARPEPGMIQNAVPGSERTEQDRQMNPVTDSAPRMELADLVPARAARRSGASLIDLAKASSWRKW